jgi:uncharacterized coiled-coil DUF342 family protein
MRDTIATLSAQIRDLKKQIDRQAEAITARNIKILKLERQIAAMEAKERAKP